MDSIPIELPEQVLMLRRGSRSPTPTPEEQEKRALMLKNDLLLHEAVIKNDPEAVKKILKEPLDINSRNNYGRAPIHWAASRGSTDIMEMLIAANCDIEARDKYGMRPILMAAWHGHKDAVQVLVNAGASTNAVNKKQFGLLHCAAATSRLSVVDFLLDFVESVSLDTADHEGRTALHHAAGGGHLAVTRRLVEAGTNISTTDTQGRTPLHAAAAGGHRAVVEYLISAGLGAGSGTSAVNVQDGQGNGALHLAAEGQQTEVVGVLLDAGADSDLENQKGFTPLHIASNQGCRGIIEALVQHGSCLNKQSKTGSTPLHLACQANETDTVELLIAKGADLNCLNNRLQSPMHIAAEMGHTDVCKVLLAAGANIEQREHTGKTPLYVAARGSFTAIVDMIIKTARLDYPAHMMRARRVFSDGTGCPSCEHILRTELESALLPSYKPLGSPVPFLTTTMSSFSLTPEEQKTPTEKRKPRPVLNTARRKLRISRTGSSGTGAGSEENGGNEASTPGGLASGLENNERLRAVLYKLAYKQLGAGEWKRLAHHWAFTEEQIRAIEHQYTGPSSYKEHGFRMLLIWVHGLGPDVNPIKELCESLTAIDRKAVADMVRRKVDQENEERTKGNKRRCGHCNCSIT